ncbi:MAG: hypothetical protein QOI64_1377 [Solirubrobacteraceae bacterium]|jgi:hypothetical protein|nr:hypothetical protein [Solirubrobacteraceae bacterium]
MTTSDLSIGLRRDRHVELRGRQSEPWWRRGVLVVMAAVVIAALAGAFGQQHETARAETSAASVTVRAPGRIRGGLFFQGRIDIVARRAIDKPRLVLGPAWTEQMQLNTLEPAPAAESSSAGRLELEYDPLHTGDHLTLWLQFEANPTGFGRRDRSVTLLDAAEPLARVPGDLTALP